MIVHQLPHVIVVVSSFVTHPNWEPILVPALADELWIPTYGNW